MLFCIPESKHCSLSITEQPPGREGMIATGSGWIGTVSERKPVRRVRCSGGMPVTRGNWTETVSERKPVKGTEVPEME